MSDMKIVKVDFKNKQPKSDELANLVVANEPLNSHLGLGEVSQILDSLGDITYYWDIVSGEITFSENINQLADYIDIEKITNTAGFTAALDPENVTNRYQTVCNSLEQDFGTGVDYHLDYRMANAVNVRKGYWIEDKGKWFVGSNGLPENACGVMRIMDKRQDAQQELALYGTHDILTGFINRIQLREKIKQTVDAIEKHQKEGAFLLVGIDNLGMINEAYGMDVADEAIAIVAKRIQGLLRKTDVIGRYSGNKIGVILNECPEQYIKLAAERIIQAIGQDVIKTGSEAVSVTLSAGGISIPKHSKIPQDIMQLAEETLILAKNRPVESFALYQASAERENYRKTNISVAEEIVNALNDRRVKIVYQPIVHTGSGEIESYECLIRIVDKRGDLIPNGQLIPVAESLNLMRLLDHRVLELAVQKLVDAPQVNLSVNISANTISDSGWLDCLIASVGGKPQLSQRLTIEITETALLSDTQYTIDFVSKIHNLGCKVSIDDFGSGYTSFQNLKMLDVDVVKIDGTFIENLRNSDDDRFFVKTMNDLAKHFNIKTVAEWVEHEEDVAILNEIGIDYLQGFYFGSGQDDLRDVEVLGDMYMGIEEDIALPSVG